MAQKASVEFDAVKAARPSAFPVRGKQSAGSIAGVHTEVNIVYLADKILLTITQSGRLGHWVHVPLTNPDPHIGEARAPNKVDVENDGSNLLPLSHLTATTILGAANDERDTLGQLLGTQIGSALSNKHPEEKRLLVVGLGLEKKSVERSEFFQIFELVLQCIE